VRIILFFGKNHSDESKTKISDAAKKIDHSGRFKPGQPKTEGSGRASQQIEVTDITNDTTTSYDSMSAAAIALNINKRRISAYFLNNQVKPYKGRYTFKKL
jgi:hypothetical protein